MAGEVLGELRRADPGRAVEVVIQSGLRAWGDARLVQSVLTELLGNAWKFTGRRVDARIEVGRVESGGAPAFYVRDNGVGFAMSYAGKLFTTIRRLHGLGLVSVHRAIQRHAGRVWVEAAEGSGATFYFALPGRPDPGAVS
jgi:light-regulated signal transduction histidine kinase (bacteriophytochrome)